MNLKEILAQLISFQSITPLDANCQEFMLRYLKNLGFECIPLNKTPVSNFFASFGSDGPLLVFAGHTDVVPVGNEELWLTSPFKLTEKNGILYGRGTADMKGSLAAMLLMAKRFITTYPNFKGKIGFLITSAEEGDDYALGTPYVMQELYKRNIKIDYCIVGEPSSSKHIGDIIKVGRRGSLSAKITLKGVQGHVAYPHLADNPIHKISKALAQLANIQLDNGNEFFPPSSLQITYIHSGGHARNIIPGELSLDLNIRYSNEQSEASIKEKIYDIFLNHDLNPNVEWILSGEPFITQQGLLLEKCKEAIFESVGVSPELSTSGGTSDGRFIAPYGVEVIELGPINATIHQINECVALQDLEILEQIYFDISKKIFNLF